MRRILSWMGAIELEAYGHCRRRIQMHRSTVLWATSRYLHSVGFLTAIIFLLILQRAAAEAQVVAETGADRLKGKFALVIGNGAYKGSPLLNPPNDAKDIAASLRAIGFEVTLALDLDLKAMRVAIAKFVGKLADNSAALVFYAGHGVQFAGTNYLLPTDSLVNIKSPADLEVHTVSLPDLMGQITARKNAVSIFFLDACRDSPFGSVPEITGGLARTAPRAVASGAGKRRAKSSSLDGVLIAYSTAPNMVASDGVGRNSPYTKHLKDALRRPNTTLESMLKLTRSGVTIETGGSQTPWYESSVNGDFYPAGQGRIAFEELLKLLLPMPHDRLTPNDHNIYGWDLGSTEFSPIQWTHEGVRSATDKTMVRDFNQREWGSFVREGKVVITLDGIPTHHEILRQKTPSQWRIVLTGYRGGFDAVSITNDAFPSHEFNGFAASPLLKEDMTCRTGEPAGGTTVYSVGIADRIPAWLAEAKSCGNGGCIHEYLLFYNKQDRNRFGCRG